MVLSCLALSRKLFFIVRATLLEDGGVSDDMPAARVLVSTARYKYEPTAPVWVRPHVPGFYTDLVQLGDSILIGDPGVY